MTKIISFLFIVASLVLAESTVKDIEADCSKWADKCNKDEYVTQNCQKTCSEQLAITFETNATTAVVATSGPCGNATDVSTAGTSKCQKWAKKGYCSFKFKSYMTNNCASTCCERAAAGTIDDNHANCDQWANTGWCGKNTFVTDNCKNTCKAYNAASVAEKTARQCTRWVGTDDASHYCIHNDHVKDTCVAQCLSQDKDKRCQPWSQDPTFKAWCSQNNFVMANCPASCARMTSQ